jgi:hypothetical protein
MMEYIIIVLNEEMAAHDRVNAALRILRCHGKSLFSAAEQVLRDAETDDNARQDNRVIAAFDVRRILDDRIYNHPIGSEEITELNMWLTETWESEAEEADYLNRILENAIFRHIGWI